MTAETATESLVVIALDVSERKDYAIELAGWLAQTETRELLGLYVENATLLEHASSRWAREILVTGSERALDRGKLERQLRAQAGRARARFEAASAKLGLRHRFEIARGDVLFEPIRRAAKARALVVSLAQMLEVSGSPRAFLRLLVEAGLPLVLLAREGWLSGTSVAVLVSADTDGDLALEAAVRVARHARSPITALLPLGPASEREQRVQRIEHALRLRGVDRSEIILLHESAMAGVLQAMRACRARLLVLPSPTRPDESAEIEELLRRFPGALMLVRP